MEWREEWSGEWSREWGVEWRVEWRVESEVELLIGYKWTLFNTTKTLWLQKTGNVLKS